MASSQSSSDARGPASADGGWRRTSPIPYRRGPFDYEPAVFCHYAKKAALWISWSDDNPGRRYFKCYHGRSGGCNFMGWYEGPIDQFVASLLVDFRDAVWTLKRERMELKAAIADVVVKMEQQKKEICGLKLANEALIAGDKTNARKPAMARFWIFGILASVAAGAVFKCLG